MAAGDLVVADWQVELRTTLMGATTAIEIDRTRGGISGLFDEAVELPESAYVHAPGSFIGMAREGARTATFALEITGTATTALTALETMRTVWKAGTAVEPLHFRVPGYGKSYVNGWPAGVIADTTTMDFGVISLLATFRITDPTIYAA